MFIRRICLLSSLFVSLMSMAQLLPSTDTQTHWYLINAPLRHGGYYVSASGAGKDIVSTEKPTAFSCWKFVERSDGSFDIISYTDQTYISPTSADNTALKCQGTRPEKGWTLIPAALNGYYAVVSGSTQMNQANPAQGFKLYNWGYKSEEGNGYNLSDTGCQFDFHEVEIRSNGTLGVVYREPEEVISATDKAEWASKAPFATLTWASRDIQYPRHKMPAISEAQKEITVTAWRGERIGLQALYYSNSNSVEPLSVAATTNSPLGVETGWLRYVLADEFLTCGNHPTNLAPFTCADMLDPGAEINVPACEVRPIWTSIEVPRDCAVGVYELSINVNSSKGMLQSLKLRVNVLDRQLPESHDYTFHLDLWQQPYSVSRYYGVEPWSDEHLELLKPYMKRLARAGQKVVSAVLFYEPWGQQSNDKFQPMIETILLADGTWAYDYTVFDKWVNLMAECGIDHQIDCFSMVPWDMAFRYWDQATGTYKTLKTKTSEEDYKNLWVSFLKAFARHLKEKGWFEKTCIAMDERGLNDMMNAYNIAQEAVPGIKMSLAGNYHKELIPLLHDYCIAYGQQFSAEELAERRAKGRFSTVYTCCTEQHPNIFTASQPCEAAMLPLFCAAGDFDGYLHWSWINWTDFPMTESRFKYFAPGDTYFFYPGPRTSPRFERLTEGIQQYEKVKIMRNVWKKNGQTDKLQALDAALKETLNTLGDNPKEVSEIVNRIEAMLNK